MNLKLTAYFGERLRGERRFVSDELLDLYAAERVATSVVLRGIAGFGPRHDVRSDLTLSLSEDLPAVVTAVGDADQIRTLADAAATTIERGIVTLERVGSAAPTKVSVYLGRRGAVSYRTVCDVMYTAGLAGSTAYLGVDGVIDGQRRRARFLGTNPDVPVVVIGYGSAEQVQAALPQLQLPGVTVTLERAELNKRDGRLIAAPSGAGPWQKLTVHTSEATLHDGAPVHRALVAQLRERRLVNGVTVVRGIWGFHGDHAPHGDRLLQLSRRVPVTTIMVDTPERIAAAFPVIDKLTEQQGLVTSEDVPALLSIDCEQRRGSLDLDGRGW